MHGHTNRMYDIHVSPNTNLVLQHMQVLSSIDEINKILDTVDETFEEGGLYTQE